MKRKNAIIFWIRALAVCLAYTENTLFSIEENLISDSRVADQANVQKETIFREQLPSIFHLKGILLVKNQKDIKINGVRNIVGLQVKNVEVPGNFSRLQNQIESLLKKEPFSKNLLEEIKKTILAHYYANNRPVVAVSIPEQEITGGAVQIVVFEGQVGEIRCLGNKWFSSKRIKKYMRVKEGEQINKNIIYQDIAWINRNPFRHVDVSFTKGKKEGQTDLELFIRDEFPLRVYAGVDNTGSKATDLTRIYSGFNWGNAFNLDHLLSFQYTTSPSFKKFQGYTVNYLAPLPWRHIFMLYGGYSSSHPKLKKVHKDFKVFESATYEAQTNLRYQIPWEAFTDSSSKQLTLGFDYKHKKTNLLLVRHKEKLPNKSNRVDVGEFMGRFDYRLKVKKHEANFNIEVFYSPGEIFPFQSNRDFNSSRHGAKNKYVYSRIAAGDVFSLPKGYSLRGLFRGQAATGALLSSEQYGLGGYDTIRGYAENEVMADNAVIANVELHYPTVRLLKLFNYNKVKDNLFFLVFFDYGYGHDYKTLKGQKTTHWLMSVGPGFRYTIGSNLSVRFDWGAKLHRLPNAGQDPPRTRIHFAVIASY